MSANIISLILRLENILGIKFNHEDIHGGALHANYKGTNFYVIIKQNTVVIKSTNSDPRLTLSHASLCYDQQIPELIELYLSLSVTCDTLTYRMIQNDPSLIRTYVKKSTFVVIQGKLCFAATMNIDKNSIPLQIYLYLNSINADGTHWSINLKGKNNNYNLKYQDDDKNQNLDKLIIFAMNYYCNIQFGSCQIGTSIDPKNILTSNKKFFEIVITLKYDNRISILMHHEFNFLGKDNNNNFDLCPCYDFYYDNDKIADEYLTKEKFISSQFIISPNVWQFIYLITHFVNRIIEQKLGGCSAEGIELSDESNELYKVIQYETFMLGQQHVIHDNNSKQSNVSNSKCLENEEYGNGIKKIKNLTEKGKLQEILAQINQTLAQSNFESQFIEIIILCSTNPENLCNIRTKNENETKLINLLTELTKINKQMFLDLCTNIFIALR